MGSAATQVGTRKGRESISHEGAFSWCHLMGGSARARGSTHPPGEILMGGSARGNQGRLSGSAGSANGEYRSTEETAHHLGKPSRAIYAGFYPPWVSTKALEALVVEPHKPWSNLWPPREEQGPWSSLMVSQMFNKIDDNCDKRLCRGD